MLVINIDQISHSKQNRINKWLNKEIPRDTLIRIIINDTGKRIK